MDEVLTHMDYNTITRTEGQGERAVTRLLIKTLMRRGDKAFSGLMSALEAMHYSHVTQRLQSAAMKLRMAMEDEKRTPALTPFVFRAGSTLDEYHAHTNTTVNK
ncbi:hypothetical protein EGW08_013462, partial [Elysia chlorotica]